MPLQETRSNDFCFIFHLFTNYNKDELATKEDYIYANISNMPEPALVCFRLLICYLVNGPPMRNCIMLDWDILI
jgi:hypothetical protein